MAREDTRMNDDEVAAGLAPTPGYRYADVVDDRLFVAGQVPLDAEGELVGGEDPHRQATQCLDNLQTLIDLHGFELGHIRHLTIHVVGAHDNLLRAWNAVNEWFDAQVPPATLLGAHLLGHVGQLVEIDATVVRATAR
ncbi:MAG: RidA family protein [Actinomycetota bacterium]